MDEITILIKAEIKRQYKSIRQFSQKSGIPYSTLSNALTKGFGGTSYDTVVKICKLLDIKQIHASDLTLTHDRYHDFISRLSMLDETAMHTVETVLNLEYDRCKRNGDSSDDVSATA